MIESNLTIAKALRRAIALAFENQRIYRVAYIPAAMIIGWYATGYAVVDEEYKLSKYGKYHEIKPLTSDRVIVEYKSL